MLEAELTAVLRPSREEVIVRLPFVQQPLELPHRLVTVQLPPNRAPDDLSPISVALRQARAAPPNESRGRAISDLESPRGQGVEKRRIGVVPTALGEDAGDAAPDHEVARFVAELRGQVGGGKVPHLREDGDNPTAERVAGEEADQGRDVRLGPDLDLVQGGRHLDGILRGEPFE